MKLVSKPIDIVVVFCKNETPRPYKFLYIDEDGEEHEVKIDKILGVTEHRIPGVSTLMYDCQSIKGCNAYRYQLNFDPKTLRWILYKI